MITCNLKMTKIYVKACAVRTSERTSPSKGEGEGEGKQVVLYGKQSEDVKKLCKLFRGKGSGRDFTDRSIVTPGLTVPVSNSSSPVDVSDDFRSWNTGGGGWGAKEEEREVGKCLASQGSSSNFTRNHLLSCNPRGQ